MRIALGITVAVGTLAAWGGRIGLLTADEGIAAWVRIGGSLVIGLIAAATLLIPKLEAARRPALIVFVAFTIILWTRSLMVNWTGPGTLSFKTVHTVLAIGFFALAWWVYAYMSRGEATSAEEASAAASGEAHHLEQATEISSPPDA